MKNTILAVLVTLFTACVDAPETTSSTSTDSHADTSDHPLGTIEDLCRASARDACKGEANFERCVADEYAQCIAG